MAQTIRRSGKGVRRAAVTRGAKARVATARKQTGTLVGQAVRRIPISDEALHRLLIVGMVGGVLALLAAGAMVAGVPDMVEQHFAEIAGNAGFKVKRVEVRGVNRMNELTIYEKVLGQRDEVMSRLDLAALRTDLLQLSWVKDARVARQLPDTLVVDVVERSPHAVLRENGHFTLIDETGHELEAVPASRAKGMLVLTGTGAEGQIAGLDKLLDTAPALKSQVAEAEWVGNRRWNLTFKTGQVLALPEGDDEGAAALLTFARMDGVDRLLGGKVAAFDMRVPDRIYLRIPGHADEIAAEAKAAAVAKAAAKASGTSAPARTGTSADGGGHAAPRPAATAKD
ncbi:cell division protein FtsQ [Novosphingobium nitrogenifigens DSM 19370]|uniref:Cell division protein FtsQ n=1 Tax=Novosphingobium nitrogenifigens DSM 19370 TaxID=983920 RepID=F1ZDQ9_9SPHN|nr:cell division protein FtsQ/DivIB [Novosphingobium nitrogenifigens]EGD57357.1 cell division protein FtsQ [Novosphingobium nitrogenifigens DSM 19370]